jgi:sigma-B regulation protein RsbU (phosphoserine phosphatase)
VAAINSPAQKVSGDYYDFIRVNEDCVGLAIADVSGKGIAASLVMAMCRSMLRGLATQSLSPAQVLRDLNRRIHPDLREDMFITMIYVVVNTRTGAVSLARAGHETPLLFRNHFSEMELLQKPGLALGIDSGDIFDGTIQDTELTMGPEDTLVLYTDGLSETVDAQGKEFGRENLKDAIVQSSSQGVEFLVDNVMERVRRFSGQAPPNDDITLVALQRTCL